MSHLCRGDPDPGEGLVVSTLFTLLFVPTLFSLTMDARDYVSGRIRRRQTDQVTSDIEPVPLGQ